MQQTRSEVKTVAALTNVALADGAVKRALEAPPHLPRMLTLSGPSGYGKSSAASYLRSKHRAYYIECKSTWTRRAVLENILKDMGIVPATTIYHMTDQVCEQLALSGRPLVIDEMDHLVEKAAVEIVRDIYDGSRGVVMIIGEEQLPHKLKRWERFHGRILEWVAAQPADIDDALTLAQFYCRRVPAEEAAVAMLLKQAKGSARRICVNLELAQEQAMKAGLSVITAEFLASLTLYTGEAPTRRI